MGSRLPLSKEDSACLDAPTTKAWYERSLYEDGSPTHAALQVRVAGDTARCAVGFASLLQQAVLHSDGVLQLRTKHATAKQLAELDRRQCHSNNSERAGSCLSDAVQ